MPGATMKEMEVVPVPARTSTCSRCENLQLGGNGLIPRGHASNPTLTTVAYGVRGSEHIIRGGK